MGVAPWREAVLIIRVWFEGDPPSELRVRIVEVGEGQPRERVIAVAASEEDIHAAVRNWLESLTPR